MTERWALWYGEPVPCPTCATNVTPVFSQGFWRIPEHTFVGPCDGAGVRVVAQ